MSESIFDLLKQGRDETPSVSRIYGAVVGLVTNNKDPEQLGRVKVKFPWLAENSESHWARIATLDAGKDRGTWWIPEIDDEVLCIFEHGDINFPYVIGGLWNGKDKPPTTGRAGDFNQDGKDDLRFIKSRDDHLLIFEEPRGITLQTASGHVVDMHEGAGPNASTHPAWISLKTRNDHVVELSKGVPASHIFVRSESGHRLELQDTPKGLVTMEDKTHTLGFQLNSDERRIVLKNDNPTSITIRCPTGTIKLEALNIEIKGMAMVTITAPIVKIN